MRNWDYKNYQLVVILWFIASAFLVSARAQQGPTLPRHARQLVVAVAEGWEQSSAKLQCFERERAGAPWQARVFPSAIPVLLGKNGLAWGSGVLPPPPSRFTLAKREGDRRAPAGCFKIGTIYGYPERMPNGSAYPYHQVTGRDAWVDDVKLPQYNRHVIVDPANPPPWFASQKMKLGDRAYTYLVEIRHNADPPVPGHGSAIFFHFRRGANRVTSGCTTMEEVNLVKMISWLEEAKEPHYVLLPRGEYQALRPIWGLPTWP